MKQALQRLLPRNKFARAVSVLAAGTAAGQIVVVAASPLLTRLYSPEDFGLLAVYAGLLGILSVVASLRYQLAIPLPEGDKDAAGVTIVSLLAVMVMTVLSALAVWIWGESVAVLFNTPALHPYLWIMPVGLLLTGVYQVLNYWALRTRAFPAIARTKLTQALSMVGIQLGAYSLGPVALLLGRVAGQSVGVAALARVAIKRDARIFMGMKTQYLRQAAAKYRHFPLISTWTGLSSAGGTHIPPLLIAALLGASPAGVFALTHRVLSQPMALLGNAVGDVFYREAAQAHREGGLHKVVERVYANLVATALPVAMIIFLSAPAVFVFVFGAEWALAGEVARWMTPWLFFQFIAAPPTRIYPILNKHGIALRFQVSLLLTGVISVLVGALVYDSVIVSVALLSILNSLVYLVRLAVAFSLVGIPAFAPVREFTRAIAPSVLCNLPLIGIWVFEGAVAISSSAELGLFLFALALVGCYVVRNLSEMTSRDPVLRAESGGKTPNG